MAQSVFAKQPAEVVPLGVDFREEMGTGEAISSANSEVIVYDSDGNEVDSMLKAGSLAVQDSTILQATIQGGDNGSTYKVTFRAWISDDKYLEHDVILVVQD